MSENKLLLDLVKRHPGAIAIAIFLGLAESVFNGVSATLIVPILVEFVGNPVDFSDAPLILDRLVTAFDALSPTHHLAAMTGGVVLLVMLRNLAQYGNAIMANSLTRSLTADLRGRGIQLLLEIDLEFYHTTKLGDLVNCLGIEINRAASSIRNGIRMAIAAIAVLVFLGLLISISPPLTLVSTAVVGAIAAVNQHFIARSRHFGKRFSETSQEYSIRVMETLTGIQLIKATANEEKEYRRLLQAIENCEKADFLAQANSAAIAPLSEVMSLFAILLIVGLGNVFFPTQIASLSAILLTYLFLLFRLLPLIAQLNGFRSKFANRASSIKAVNEFLRRDNKPFSKNGNCHYVPIAQGIHFDGVSFAYGDRAPQVLDGIDLQLYRGETLALVGASGAGKSTVAKLLPRFYNPTAGKITLDGRDLREFDVKSLRKAMGIVSQETVLFNESVFENIAYGKPHATEAEVIEAAKQAKAYEFIVELPQGFQTKIGDRGICLSGGQRQRLAIARTLLQDPDILILDEATSALDAISERAIREAIENLSRNRTTLAIAHRLSAVQNADRIAVLDKGRIVEIGTHDQLLARGGHYTQLYRMQCETA